MANGPFGVDRGRHRTGFYWAYGLFFLGETKRGKTLNDSGNLLALLHRELFGIAQHFYTQSSGWNGRKGSISGAQRYAM